MRLSYALMAGLLLAAPTRSADLEENEATLGGGAVQADDLWLCGMNLYVRKDRPVTMMGMIRYLNQPRSFNYVFIVKGDEERTHTPTWKSEPSIVGRNGREIGSIAIGDKRVEFTYTIEIDPKGKALPKETLVINNVRTDPKGGRVFLIDCSRREVVWQQLDLRLPVPPPVPTSLADVEAQSLQMVKDLKVESAVVREFLRTE
jgi:hypothetical protein